MSETKQVSGKWYSRFQTQEDVERFGRDLENVLYEAANFIEAAATYDEQCDRENAFVGHLPESVRDGIIEWFDDVVERKAA